MRWHGRKVTIMAVPKVNSLLNQMDLMSYKQCLAVAAARNNFLDLKFFTSYGPPV